MADSPEVMVAYYESLKREEAKETAKEVEVINKTALVEWIKDTMSAMGTPPAYSYKVGVYHGMERVLKQIQGGNFALGEGDEQ